MMFLFHRWDNVGSLEGKTHNYPAPYLLDFLVQLGNSGHQAFQALRNEKKPWVFLWEVECWVGGRKGEAEILQNQGTTGTTHAIPSM